MARVTVEDSLEKAKNRFALTQLTAQRAKQLLNGSKPLCNKKSNREIVTALREIAEGKVKYAHPEILDSMSADEQFTVPAERSMDFIEDASDE